MPSLFLSHASQDRELAADLFRHLRVAGLEAVFLDFDPDLGIPPGRAWEPELYAQLRRCDGVVFLATPAALASRWCAIELGIAKSIGRTVFPVQVPGTGRHPLLEGVQSIDLGSDPDAGFGRLVGAIRSAFGASDSFTWDARRSPYPGLASFTADDAAVFFGRDSEIQRLNEMFGPRAQGEPGRLVAVVGPSGSGKSSLVRAGLLPRLRRQAGRWVLVPRVVPGEHPVRQVASSLARAFGERGNADQIYRRLQSGAPELVAIAHDLVQARGRDANDVLLFIDQMEELVTRSGARQREEFLGLLRGSVARGSPLWAVATVRSDHLALLVAHAELADLADETVTVLPIPRRNLPTVIERPAQRAGLSFEAGLVGRMVDETSGGDALPLLAYTLSELAQLARPGAAITAAAYEAVGGVAGAIERQADRAHRDLQRRGLGHVVMPTLLRFVDWKGPAPTSRRIEVATFISRELDVVGAFADARLLTIDGTSGAATVGVAHEALLRQWEPLSSAIEDGRAVLELRSEIEELALEWHASGRDDAYLLRGVRLHAVDSLPADVAATLGPTDHDFLAASRRLAARELEAVRRSSRRRLQVIVTLLGLLAATVVAAATAVRQAGVADERARDVRQQAGIAESRQLAALATALLSSNPEAAMLVAVESLHVAPTEEAVSAVQAGLARPHHASRTVTSSFTPQALAFSPDGQLLAAGGDSSVQLWEVAALRPVGEPFIKAEGTITSVAFSPDNRWVAASCTDGTVTILDAATGVTVGEPLATGHGFVWDVAFAPDTGLLASVGDDGAVRLWDVATRTAAGEPMAQRDQATAVAFSGDGRFLASAAVDSSGHGTIRVWDPHTGLAVGQPLDGLAGPEGDLAFGTDGRLATAVGRLVELRDVATGQPAHEALVGHTGTVLGVAFSTDGRLVASTSADGSVRLWTVDGNAVEDVLIGHDGAVWDVAFTPNGREVASAGQDRSIRLWDIDVDQALGQLAFDHGSPVSDVAVSPDGRMVVAAGFDGSVEMWDVEAGVRRGSRYRPPTGDGAPSGRAVALSVDGLVLVSAGDDGTVRTWNTERGVPVHETVIAGTALSTVAVTSDGSLVATADYDGSIRLWDVGADGGSPTQLSGHHGPIQELAFSPDDTLLASAGGDGTVRFWDVGMGSEIGSALRHATVVEDIAFSPDGGLLASASDDGVHTWDVARRRETGPALLADIPSLEGGPASVAFSDEGRVLVTGAHDGTVQFWDVAHRQPFGHALHAGDEAVRAIDSTTDGQFLVSGGVDGAVRVWAGPVSWLDATCRRAGRNLTMDEWRGLMGDTAYRRTCEELPAGVGAPADALSTDVDDAWLP